MNDECSSSNIVVNNLTATVGLSADPPFPPNWNANLEDTVRSLVPYKLFPIAADTLEYATIAALLYPFKTNTVEQIVNPMLWSRFVNTRKDMLLSKSDDLRLLSRLSFDEREILRATHHVLNFDKHAQVAACPYDDNVALLFHCTRTTQNVDNILLQGLDERVGNSGTLGRGIYFASDPHKSMAYDGCGGTIFIFMVLLGDCLSVNRNNISKFVREPEKQPVQQRNFSDISFDSIVGQPGAACEYVVYNRYQCCPLYKISYGGAATGAGVINSIYSQSKTHLPPFSWTSTTNSPAMPSASNSDWPFYAKTIFTQMGVQQIQEMDVDMVAIEESAESIESKIAVLSSLGFTNTELNLDLLKNNSFNIDRTINNLLELSGGSMIDEEESAESIESKMTVLSSLGFTNTESNLDLLKNNSFNIDRTINNLLELSGGSMIDESEILINNKLAMLPFLGFTDAELNVKILKKNSYDLNKCVSELMERSEEDTGAQIDHRLTFPPSKNALNVPSTKPISSVDVEKSKDCPICCNEIDALAVNWKVLHCGHKLCSQCYKQIKTTRTTMAGVTHTFTKCPFCMKTSGVNVGVCPDGTMTTTIVPTPCEGYERYQSIRIQYDIKWSASQLHRTAYLPNNDEGNDLLKLLRIAWDRRVCFTIGTSVTDGRENVLVWNIHHKTAQNGGVQSHGFPDETFIERCRLELKTFGIE